MKAIAEKWRLPAWESIVLLSLVIHLLAAVFSTGFHHFDEHFQIFEFLNYKLGGITGDELAWEFREQIRPWFQVWVYHGLHHVHSLLGVTSPFTHAFLLRLWTSILGWMALVALWPVIQLWIKKERWQLLAFALVNFAWFVPYIQARTSSESFGIIFFFFGLNLFLVPIEGRLRDWRGLFAGLFFGLCYLSRFQLALMVAPLWFWLLCSRSRNWTVLLQSAAGVLLAIGLGVVVDFWGYGEWTFSLWHYFRTNFLGGIMSSVQQYPFYWYFRWALLRGIPPLSLPLIMATLAAWWRWPRHPLFWITLPLVLFHSWVGHKELRYLFPVIMLTPIYLVMWLEQFDDHWPGLQSKRWPLRLGQVLAVLNLLFLLVATFRAANPAINFYREVYNRPDIKRIVAIDESPFTMLGLPINYFKRRELDIVVTHIENLRWEKEIYLFTRTGADLLHWSTQPGCQLLTSAYPAWTLQFNWGNWLSRSRVWSLFHCQK